MTTKVYRLELTVEADNRFPEQYIADYITQTIQRNLRSSSIVTNVICEPTPSFEHSKI